MTNATYAGPHRRYATALLNEAQVAKKLEQVATDMATLAQAAATDADFRAVLEHPLVHAEDTINLFEALAKKYKFQPITLTFLKLIVRNGRTNTLPQVCQAFAEQMRELNGEQIITVTTAAPLTKEDLKVIEKTAAASLPASKKLSVQEVLDTDVIAGVKINLGATEIDMTTQGALNRLKQQLTA